MDKNVYIKQGYKNRKDYLASLAEEYGDEVYILAQMLGPEEDFDGLVSSCEDLEFELGESW